MKKRSATILLIFFVLFLAAMVAIAFVVAGGAGKGSVPEKVILEVDLETEILEYKPIDDPFTEAFLDSAMTTRDVVDAVDRAADDERVVAMVAKIGAAPIGFAQLQEIRSAIERFRASGKKAVAWSETFGEFSPGNGAYYLATAFDEIHLQPSGDVGLVGLLLEGMFLRGTLDKLEVEPQMDHRHEYKNAMNTFTETEFTDAHREAMSAIMESVFGGMVEDMAQARAMEEAEMRSVIDRGPYLGQEAVDAGLIDRLSYRDQVYDGVKSAAGENAELLYLDAYLDRAGRPHAEGETIALIYGAGQVTRGTSQFNPFTGDITMGSDTVAGAFRKAIEDDKVKAILFRVDSPGGSYVASDTIWRETLRAKEAGKPVIVSMGNLAASGGYFVSMSADKIVAQPGTLTGSIGVLGGKLVTTGLWNKLGLSFDDVQSSENATQWSANHPYDEAEWERFQAWLDRVYDDFTTKVAEGRGLTVERARELAKGRVWTGEDAFERGLVDELGGFDVALRLTREAAGLAPDDDVKLVVYPKPRSPFEELFGDKASSSEDSVAVEDSAMVALRRLVVEMRPLVRLGQRLGLVGEPAPGPVALPPELVYELEEIR